ncbi:RNA polymerase sigma-70 factor [Dysgonomonas sp. Marseille-P4677]|uniref:RNA polymerase sigma-70 factor n=1 Tax=Dysgonomonas sp. Marseille-P4677 TaxID=2364790 RepID=UPI001F28A9AF|nr:RNA polymerase sigma-70 factor [Dysgonomonas sp. Marseille-P4677]
MKEDLKIKEIYDKYYNKAYSFVRSYVYDKDAVEDIVSEAIIKLWQELKHKNDIEHNITPFLFSILKNMSLDYLRHLVVKQKVLDKLNTINQRELELRIMSLEDSSYDEILVREIQDIVDATILKMKDRTQEIFRLSRFELLTNKEIAKKLGITEKGVEYHISIALKMLRESLKDYINLIAIFPFLYNYYFLLGYSPYSFV